MSLTKKYGKFLARKHDEYMRDLTSLGNPLALVLISLAAFGFSRFFWLTILGLVINEGIGSLIKLIFPKTRPNGQKYKNSLEKMDAGSFPSIHSSRIAFTYLMVAANSTELAIKIIFAIFIVIVGYTRTYLKKHFWVDVIFGWIFGTIMFIIINSLF
jgi:undecaprenyl-diphosphatase